VEERPHGADDTCVFSPPLAHRCLAAGAQVWENKEFKSKPFLVRGDGPVAALRRWYKQFYSERCGGGGGEPRIGRI
jgi:hypothetical protein